ncbi:MAG: hypothetical protein R2848_01760 [Thermomicrobiales bacterium]
MTLSYFLKRVGMFLLVIWLAATVNFFLPRLGGGDPVRQKMAQTAALGGNVQGGMDEVVAEYNKKFGLDTPLWKQYLNYLWDLLHFDFNYSIANYPSRVIDIIGKSLPGPSGCSSRQRFFPGSSGACWALSWAGRARRSSSSS